MENSPAKLVHLSVSQLNCIPHKAKRKHTQHAYNNMLRLNHTSQFSFSHTTEQNNGKKSQGLDKDRLTKEHIQKLCAYQQEESLSKQHKTKPKVLYNIVTDNLFHFVLPPFHQNAYWEGNESPKNRET